MNPEQSQPPGSPIPGVAIVIALIVGVLFVTDIPYKSSRPKNPDDVKPLSSDTEDVRARLWEDPFAAVERHRKKLESGKHESCKHNEQRLICEIRPKKDLSISADVVILGVMVFGGPYAENIERRIRSRYAILSALATLGYVPEDAEHLGYIKNQNKNKGITDIIPYEWLIPCKIKPASKPKKPKPPILLLWLNDDAFSQKPLKKLGELKNLLESKANADGTPELIFKIVGPAGSTNLMAMVEEIYQQYKHLERLKGIEIFSPSATVDDNLILKQNEIDCNLNIEDLFKKKLPHVKFMRTIGTDKLLTDALLDELTLRGVDPQKDHIVLLSEWDTFYGRALPITFSKSVEDRPDVQTAQKNIHRFSYLRGIDGKIPSGSRSNISNAASLNGEKPDKKDKKAKTLERPVGQNQLDYIRRLAVRLKHLDKQLRCKDGYGVKAIGVLGSDVYDKLLLLQALHAEFQSVIFFTTDLDARLLYPDELKWTRNLIIASNFGLQLNQLLQKNIPPFRDNYQTSMFFSTLIAMNSSKGCCNQNIIDACLSTPRIFEVGKNGAVDLSPVKDNIPQKKCLTYLSDSSEADLCGLKSIHPQPADKKPNVKTICWICAGTALAILLIILYILFYKDYYRLKKISIIPALCFVVVTILGCLVLGCIICTNLDCGEPFSLFEGVSIWPSEFLRFLTEMLACYFLYAGYGKLKQKNSEVDEFLESVQSIANKKKSIITGCKDDEKVDALSLWKTYSQLCTSNKKLYKILLLSIIYFSICWIIIQLFGEPFIPYRGKISFIVDKCIILSAAFLLVLLIFRVIEVTNFSIWFIRCLSRENTTWPSDIIQRVGGTRYRELRSINDWIDIKVIAKHSEAVLRLIYAPFVIIFLLLIARSCCFDNWGTPIGLMIVILLSLIYAVCCAVILKNEAEKTKQNKIQHLQELLMKFIGQGAKAKDKYEQINFIILSISSIRSGALAPFFQQPWIRALLLSLSGGGGFILLEML